MPSPTPQSRRRTSKAHSTTTTAIAMSAAGPRQRPRGATAPGGPDRSDLCEVQVVDHRKVGRARAALPDRATLAGLAEMLRALGDPTRLQIVCALAAPGVDELCVCDLATLVDVSDSAVSHSLRTLRQLGLVRYRKVGKIAYYALDDAHVGELVREGIQHIERDS